MPYPERRPRVWQQPTNDPIMYMGIERVDLLFGPLALKLTEREDEQHIAFNSLPTNVLFMAQELLKVKMQLQSAPQIVGRELT